MKILSILQMIFGALAAFVAWALAQAKAGMMDVLTPGLNPDGTIIIKTDSPPPDSVFEFTLLFLGLAILVCGYLQLRKKQREAGIQLVSGIVISGIAGFLAVRAATTGYGEISAVYYLAYVPLALGVIVLIVGITQFIRARDLVN
jgi:hypothetical protein